MSAVGSFASGAIARCTNVAALQAIGGSSGDLCFIWRQKVDAILAVPTGGASAVFQIDDLTNPNAKAYFHVQDTGGTAKQIQLQIPGAGSSGTGYIPNAKWGALGTYIVVMMYHKQSTTTHGFGIFDGTGTNTLLDGLARGSSVFWGSATYSSPFPIIAGNGSIALNLASSGASRALALDGFIVLSAVPTVGTEDAVPTAGMANLLAGCLFTDAIGSTSFANLKAGGPAFVAAPSNGVTLITPAAWPAQTYTPTTVTGTPSSPACTVGTTVQLVPSTKDQFGATGTLTPTTRTYSYASGATGIATVNGSGLVTGVSVGTAAITVTDTATGGGSATTWVVTVTVSAGAGTTYDVTSADATVATATTGVTGTAGSIVTAVGRGTTTLTVTRHPSGPSCTIPVTDTQPAGGYPSFSYPNRPTGMTLLSYRDAQTAAPGSESPGAWGSNTGATNLSEVTDATVPWGGPNTTAIQYPIGLVGGNTPTFNWCLAPHGKGYRRMYAAFAWKLQVGFVYPTAGLTKVWYQKPTQGSNTMLICLDNGNGTYMPQFRTQSPGPTTLNFGPNVAGQTGFAIPEGTWCIWEMLAQLNTAVVAPYNGIVKMWMTIAGVTVQTHDYATIGMTSIVGDTWDEWDFQPYWGGAGGTIVTPQYSYLGPAAMFGGV